MSSLTVSIIALFCLFGGGLLGMLLRSKLPEYHLADDSRHLLETSLGIIGTIGGLVLGLLVGSAFGQYNAERSSLVSLSANIVVLDRILAHYGPQTKPARSDLRRATARMIDQIWPEHRGNKGADPAIGGNEALYDEIEALNPTTDTQKSIKGEAVGVAIGIGQARWLMYEQLAAGVSPVLIGMLIFWFTITFVGLGIFAKPNPTVVTALFLAAVAVSAALYLLQGMYEPFSGPMQISSGPMRVALANLGR